MYYKITFLVGDVCDYYSEIIRFADTIPEIESVIKFVANILGAMVFGRSYSCESGYREHYNCSICVDCRRMFGIVFGIVGYRCTVRDLYGNFFVINCTVEEIREIQY